MNPHAQQEKLMLFCDSLSFEVASTLGAKNIDIFIQVNEACSAYEFVLYETGNICEGVLKVLKGEDSPSNFVAFIQKDERIEEDNRPKIPALAYEIQQKIFDQVLPILKQAGFPIKEGRVAAPVAQPTTNNQQPTSGEVAFRPTAPSGNIESKIQNIEKDKGSQENSNQLNTPPLDERNIRALTRIAAGTEYSEQELRNAFGELPAGLRQAISSVDTANALQEIAKKRLLHVDQMASLASETGLVLLGLTHPADFTLNLARRLRLPEHQATEIARDVSAEIFAKVRDALRGLYEDVKPRRENIESRIQNVEKAQNVQQDNNQLVATSYPPAGGLKAGLQTPYSASAKWNTGENILSKQAAQKQGAVLGQASQKEGPLSRAEVLRGIENPTKVLPTTNNQQPTTERKEIRGPTGWKTVQNEPRTMKYESTERPLPPIPPRPSTPAPMPTTEKARPQSGTVFPLQRPKPEAEDFLDQKLEAPMAIPKEERRYTSDPYREPLG